MIKTKQLSAVILSTVVCFGGVWQCRMVAVAYDPKVTMRRIQVWRHLDDEVYSFTYDDIVTRQ